MIAAGVIFHHSSQLEEDAHETSCDLNYWGWLAILVISIFSYDLTFSYVRLLWIIHGSVLFFYQINDFTDDQVHICLTVIEILDTHLGLDLQKSRPLSFL